MKKIFTLLTFVFMTSAMLFGQCPEEATPNPTFKIFNMHYDLEADALQAWNDIESIVFPAFGGGTITIPKADLQYRGAFGDPARYRIRANESDDTFGGVNGDFNGSITINLTAAAGGGSETCNYVSSILPVDLVAFNGTKKDREINLNWQTASEINNEGFVIERGQKNTSDLEWNQLDFVRGNGTTDELQAYSFIDKNPAEGTNYYRLKQMDYDGAYEYSSVITVEYSTKGGSTIEMFPNPVKSELTLTNAVGQATVYNALGQAVKQLTINANQATIQLADLLNGQYYLQVLQGDGTVVTKQFSKVN